jgi:glycosyltransferase involved in cell wall biosynthesis
VPTTVIVEASSHRGRGGITYLANLLPLLAQQPGIGEVIAVVERPAALADRLAGTGVRVQQRPGPGGVPARLVWEAVALGAGARDAVALIPNAILPRRLPAAVVTVPHNISPFESGRPLDGVRRAAIIRTLRTATGVIFVSEAMRRAVRGHTQSPSLERVIPHGLSEPFRAPVPAGTRRDAIVVLGDDWPHKRVALAVQAWEGLGPDRPPLRVIGASGEGSSFEGALPPGRVADALRRARLVVLPSSAESFGLPVLEALACEAPLVLSDLAAFRETAAEHGRFVRSDSAGDWTEAMRAAMRDPPAPGPGRAWALSFDWQRTAAATAELLLEAQRLHARARVNGGRARGRG